MEVLKSSGVILTIDNIPVTGFCEESAVIGNIKREYTTVHFASFKEEKFWAIELRVTKHRIPTYTMWRTKPTKRQLRKLRRLARKYHKLP